MHKELVRAKYYKRGLKQVWLGILRDVLQEYASSY